MATFLHFVISNPNEVEGAGHSVIYKKGWGQVHFFKLQCTLQ